MIELPRAEAVAVPWLRGHASVLALLDADPLRVSGDDAPKPPYPMLRVTSTTNCDYRNLRHLIAPELLVEAWGDPDGTPGKDALLQLLATALVALDELTTRPPEPGVPVVTAVNPNGGGWSPAPTTAAPGGQPRALATVRMSLHPARVA